MSGLSRFWVPLSQPVESNMVKSHKQAARIQAKRKAAGKIGLAKAVRRFYKREGIGIY